MIKPPPRNADGEVIPHNHEDILDEHFVIRRVSLESCFPSPPAIPHRVSSMLYKPSSIGNRGMSVDLKNLIEQNGIDAKTFVSNPKFTGSILLNVGKLRELSFQVGYDPLPENPYHGEVWGTFSKANQKKISRLAQWFVEIPDVSLVI